MTFPALGLGRLNDTQPPATQTQRRSCDWPRKGDTSILQDRHESEVGGPAPMGHILQDMCVVGGGGGGVPLRYPGPSGPWCYGSEWLGLAGCAGLGLAWLGLPGLGLAWPLTLPLPYSLALSWRLSCLRSRGRVEQQITLIMWASSDTDFQTFLAFIISVHLAGRRCFHEQCDLAGSRLFVARYRRANASRVTAAGCRSPAEGPRDAAGKPSGQAGLLLLGRLSQ